MERMLLLPRPRKGRAYRPIKLCKLPRAKRVRTRIPTGAYRSAFHRVDPQEVARALAEQRSGRLVHLQFYHPSAGSVFVVGAFGASALQTFPLEHLGGGAWVVRLLLAPGRYEYHFSVDGARRPDPLATEFSYGPAGVVRSVLVVE